MPNDLLPDELSDQQNERIRRLNDLPPDEGGQYVLYWMQNGQRAFANPALDNAAALADKRGQPLVVGFGLMADYPEANERHFAFMLEGLAETAAALKARGTRLVARRGTPDAVALSLAHHASVVVADRGYLKLQRRWRERVAAEAGKTVLQVEGEVVVPIDAVSNKPEFAARTIRPKIHRRLEDFLPDILVGDHAADESEARHALSSLTLAIPADADHPDIDLGDPDTLLAALDLDRSVPRSARFRGGTSAARQRLARFIRDQLDGYATARNDPADPQTSELSPYLHFGQISPVEIASAIRAAGSGSVEDKDAFLEELIVRRELAMNFVAFDDSYDSYACLPDWARKTLAEHAGDAREHLYDMGQLARAETHDPYWNAAQMEGVKTGYMHNYMRMYWAKKILEWSPTPEVGFDTTLYLNNRFFIDGRDANSYAGVAWTYGVHDRAWTERPVFGKIRYMNANGLKRKFDIEGYVRWVEGLAG